MEDVMCRICNGFVHCEDCASDHLDWHTEAALARCSQEMAERARTDEEMRKHLAAGHERNAFNTHAADRKVAEEQKRRFR